MAEKETLRLTDLKLVAKEPRLKRSGKPEGCQCVAPETSSQRRGRPSTDYLSARRQSRRAKERLLRPLTLPLISHELASY